MLDVKMYRRCQDVLDCLLVLVRVGVYNGAPVLYFVRDWFHPALMNGSSPEPEALLSADDYLEEIRKVESFGVNVDPQQSGFGYNVMQALSKIPKEYYEGCSPRAVELPKIEEQKGQARVTLTIYSLHQGP